MRSLLLYFFLHINLATALLELLGFFLKAAGEGFFFAEFELGGVVGSQREKSGGTMRANMLPARVRPWAVRAQSTSMVPSDQRR